MIVWCQHQKEEPMEQRHDNALVTSIIAVALVVMIGVSMTPASLIMTMHKLIGAMASYPNVLSIYAGHIARMLG